MAWVLKTVPVKNVKALLPNDESGQQMGVANTAAFVRFGADLNVDYFERERVDFVPILTRLLTSAEGLEIGGAAPTTAGPFSSKLGNWVTRGRCSSREEM